MNDRKTLRDNLWEMALTGLEKASHATNRRPDPDELHWDVLPNWAVCKLTARDLHRVEVAFCQ